MNLPQNLYYQKITPDGLVNDMPVTLSTLLILGAADECGVAWKIFPGTNMIELVYQGEKKYFRFQVSTETADIGVAIANDKSMTNNLWRNAGIPVPQGFFLSRKDDRAYWLKVFSTLQKPVVVKPTYGLQGQSVFMGITAEAEFLKAVETSFNYSTEKYAGVLVEETCQGSEYRILATREKVLGIVFRRPANVVGDGVSTIEKLLEVKNADPRRGTDDTYALFKIQVDDDVMQTLGEQNLTLQSVPVKDERVFVRRLSNIARGGDSIDITDEVHPSVKELALQAINAIPGLAFAGIDFMTTDIRKPQSEVQHAFIEINQSPGFCIQVYPYEGKPRNAHYEFLKLAFPTLNTPEV